LNSQSLKQNSGQCGPLPPDYGYQAVEGEYMNAGENDMFLNDPTGFMIRR
jgi:hypothetical protein